MALFGLKTKKTTTKKGAEKAAEIATELASNPVMKGSYAHILNAPRITEKASMAMEGGVYVFDVAPEANKREIMSAINAVYKVRPRKVAIINVKPKETRNMRTGKKGMKGGFKKAYVYLKKGETITIA